MLSLLAPLNANDASAKPSHAKPNIHWLTAENIGPDMGCYGYPLARTPNLDRLAREGMRWRQACIRPASASIIIGRQRARGGDIERNAYSPTGKDEFYVLEKFAKLWGK